MKSYIKSKLLLPNPLLPVVGQLPTTQLNVNKRKDRFTRKAFCEQHPNSSLCVSRKPFPTFSIVDYKVKFYIDDANIGIQLIPKFSSPYVAIKNLLIYRKLN